MSALVLDKRTSSRASSNGPILLYYTKMDATDIHKPEEPENISAHYDVRLPKLPWHRRIQIPIIATIVYSLIRVLGPTLRYEVLGRHHAEEQWAVRQPIIWAFWHRVILPIAWYGRNRGIVIMNTTAFDGQWTRKVIEWLGYGTAQGSSSRGGLRGLNVMAQRIGEGLDCGFTIDGPRGPRYVAKVGPVLLARMTGARSEERRVGKSVDLGGRRIIKKKKKERIGESGERMLELPSTVGAMEFAPKGLRVDICLFFFFKQKTAYEMRT